MQIKPRHLIVLLAGALLGGCVSLPKGLEPVQGFEAGRYLGQWYEIARLDHRFERGLSQVTATYAPRPDGGIDVLNRGYDARSLKWRQARGRAYFVKDEATAWLKVSFFSPFYASYVIIELDRDYRWALVSGPSREYFWILARSPSLEPDRLQSLIDLAREKGFATERLIFPPQS
ncbi:MAG: Outer membrane lipoprotein Blc precursor [Deltaproteobacteria bacterium ADurb.Bin510]|nr:MAG: Outer membrane lipoprotein Blc precursor [Deltaproteobacteria bacterium ADurb.Bin510]